MPGLDPRGEGCGSGQDRGCRSEPVSVAAHSRPQQHPRHLRHSRHQRRMQFQRLYARMGGAGDVGGEGGGDSCGLICGNGATGAREPTAGPAGFAYPDAATEAVAESTAAWYVWWVRAPGSFRRAAVTAARRR
eukprot:gene15269-biopygen13086